jgi:hypothetical protein
MDAPTERHSFDPFSMLAGLLFLGLGIVFVVAESGDVSVQARWILAALLVGLGLAGALSSVARPRGGDAAAEPTREDAADEGSVAGAHVPEGS